MVIKRNKSEEQEVSQRCGSCLHWRLLSSQNVRGIRVCHYLLDTGKMRGMRAQECTRKETV